MTVHNARGVFHQIVHPVTGTSRDYDPIFNRLADIRVVLIGSGTSGTEEFHRERARMTRRLIEENGFDGVAIEEDWAAVWRMNLYVRGEGTDHDAAAAMSDLTHFPSWSWRNGEVADFLAWLRSFNDQLPVGRRKVGIYGLDLYGLHASVAAVIGCLKELDPEAAERARRCYSSFDHFGGVREHGFSTRIATTSACETAAIEDLLARYRRRAPAVGTDGHRAGEAAFYADQVEKATRKAEENYRAMFTGITTCWNFRSRHMAETLDAIMHHLTHKGSRGRVVVWGHNAQVGDARATQMGGQGERNLGQLTRQLYGESAMLLGFTTGEGMVTTAHSWDDAAVQRELCEPLKESYEKIFSEMGVPQFLITLRDKHGVAELNEARLQRGVGVVYRPESERESHYFYSRLAGQFDALVHIQETTAVEPLDAGESWHEPESRAS